MKILIVGNVEFTGRLDLLRPTENRPVRRLQFSRTGDVLARFKQEYLQPVPETLEAVVGYCWRDTTEGLEDLIAVSDRVILIDPIENIGESKVVHGDIPSCISYLDVLMEDLETTIPIIALVFQYEHHTSDRIYLARLDDVSIQAAMSNPSTAGGTLGDVLKELGHKPYTLVNGVARMLKIATDTGVRMSDVTVIAKTPLDLDNPPVAVTLKVSYATWVQKRPKNKMWAITPEDWE
jgi:hypothetical protein